MVVAAFKPESPLGSLGGSSGYYYDKTLTLESGKTYLIEIEYHLYSSSGSFDSGVSLTMYLRKSGETTTSYVVRPGRFDALIVNGKQNFRVAIPTTGVWTLSFKVDPGGFSVNGCAHCIVEKVEAL